MKLGVSDGHQTIHWRHNDTKQEIFVNKPQIALVTKIV